MTGTGTIHFSDKIDSTMIFFKHKRVLPLFTKIKDLPLNQDEHEILKENFLGYIEKIQEFLLIDFLFFIGDLKTYNQKEHGKTSDYFKSRFNFAQRNK